MCELSICLELIKKIKEKNELILEIKYRTLSPKNQIISDMPRGGGMKTNVMDDYLVKVERLQQTKETFQNLLEHEWNNAVKTLEKIGVKDRETVELMKLRFYYGLPWEKCADKMQERYPDGRWNTNKCFRVYRDICDKKRLLNQERVLV